MQITLHLKKHCIQTAAKTRYEMLMQQYFSSHKTSSKEEREKMEIEMEHLLFFLENADFSYLRLEYQQLIGIEDICVYLEVDSINNNFGIFINNKLIKIPKRIDGKLNQTAIK